jgi:hypothetical protein
MRPFGQHDVHHCEMRHMRWRLHIKSTYPRYYSRLPITIEARLWAVMIRMFLPLTSK